MSRRGTLYIAFSLCSSPPTPLFVSFLPFVLLYLSSSLCFLFLSSFLSQRWSRLMSVPLLAYFLSSESLLLFHHYHLLHPPHHQYLLITTSLHRFTGKHCAELIWRYTYRKIPLICLCLVRVYTLPLLELLLVPDECVPEQIYSKLSVFSWYFMIYLVNILLSGILDSSGIKVG